MNEQKPEVTNAEEPSDIATQNEVTAQEDASAVDSVAEAAASELASPTTHAPAVHPLEGELARRVALMEMMLSKIEKRDKAKTFLRVVQTVLLFCLVAVVSAGLYYANRTLSDTTRDVPALVSSSSNLIDETGKGLEDVLGKVDSIDFATLNTTIYDLQSGIGELRDGVSEMRSSMGGINFEGLNKSIEDLQTVTEKMAALLRIF